MVDPQTLITNIQSLNLSSAELELRRAAVNSNALLEEAQRAQIRQRALEAELEYRPRAQASGLLQEQVNALSGQVSRAHLTIAELTGRLDEWIVSERAFKLLAKSLAVRLNISMEDLAVERRRMIVKAAEENPELARTKLVTESKAMIAERNE